MKQQQNSPPDRGTSTDGITSADIEAIVNPLTIVHGYTQLLQRRLQRGDVIEDEELAQKLGFIDTAARTATSNFREVAARLNAERADCTLEQRQ